MVTIHACHEYDVLQAVAPVYYIMKQMIRKQRVMELLVRLHNFSVYFLFYIPDTCLILAICFSLLVLDELEDHDDSTFVSKPVGKKSWRGHYCCVPDCQVLIIRGALN